MYFDALIETFLKQGRIADAFNVSERARARAFLQLIGNHRIQPGRGADAALVREAEALRTQIAEWESMPASAGARNVRNDLREAQSRYAALLTRLKLSTSEYAAFRASFRPAQRSSAITRPGRACTRGCSIALRSIMFVCIRAQQRSHRRPAGQSASGVGAESRQRAIRGAHR
jgi:hypothetical protein